MGGTMIHYILVRRDLPFGTTLAMVGHAAAESMAEWLAHVAWGKHWGGMTIVVLGVRDRIALRNWELKLARKDVKMTAFHEPDSPYNGSLMAIGIWPGERDDLEPHFKKLATYSVWEGK